VTAPHYWDVIATTAGAEWAAEMVGSLTKANRAVAGGWPGTLSEARARLDAVWLTLGLKPDATTRARLTHCAYDAARSAWRSSAVRETAD
jgi:hypothetical protein